VGQGVFGFGACELDERRREFRREGRLQHLEPQVFDVLAYLINHRDRVVPKTELLDEVWGSRFVSESALTSRIKSARQAVGDTGREQTAIRTVHGHGYRFVAAVNQREGAPASDRSGSQDPWHNPALVGRSFALDRLEQGFGDAKAGIRRTIIVSGDVGIGKTALTEAFIARLDDPVVLVARGRCLEPRATAEPYLAVFDALSRLCRGSRGPEVIEVLAAAAPSWLLQMPSLLPGDRLSELRARSVGASSQRMLRELVDAIEMLSAARPFVMVLDDLHWSDGPTANLFEWLARRTDPARLLLIGTCRPEPPTGDGFGGVASTLVLGGQAEELRLRPLDASDVNGLLESWRPGLPPGVATLVHDRTAGVPLFIRDLVSSWVDTGVIVRDGDGRWNLRADVEKVARTVPTSLQVLVERELARLADVDVEMLEGAAVAGVEFASAVVGAATGQPEEDLEARCTALARRGLLVSREGVESWADGTVSARFRFQHQLHHEVLYERVPPGRRTRYHRAVGDRLERAYDGQVEEHVGELALHFDRGGDTVRAVDYLGQAAAQAMVRGAHAQALGHLDAALRHTARMPEGPARTRAELRLHLMRGMALIVTRGWATPEVEATYRHAVDLCRGVDAAPERQLVTVALATLEEMRGRHLESEALLEPQIESGPSVLAVETYELLACSAFHQGSFQKALDHARQGIAYHRPEAPNEDYARHGVDPAVLCHGWAAFASWFLGQSRDARLHIEEARALAGDQAHAVTSASLAAACLHQYRDEPQPARDWADAAARLALEHGYPFRLAQGHIIRGWARAACGEGDAGVSELRAGLDAYRSTGAVIEQPHYLGLLADALLRTDRPGDALDHVEEALAALDGSSAAIHGPELHRLRAIALLALAAGTAVDEARAALRRGLELADALQSPAARLRLLLSCHELGVADGEGDRLWRDIWTTSSRFPDDDQAPDVLRARALVSDVRRRPAS
jgi:DNA-binding winged helix-turn-helix (wHTH) protein/tetratricopeptide (TPR) repeat protein